MFVFNMSKRWLPVSDGTGIHSIICCNAQNTNTDDLDIITLCNHDGGQVLVCKVSVKCGWVRDLVPSTWLSSEAALQILSAL